MNDLTREKELDNWMSELEDIQIEINKKTKVETNQKTKGAELDVAEIAHVIMQNWKAANTNVVYKDEDAKIIVCKYLDKNMRTCDLKGKLNDLIDLAFTHFYWKNWNWKREVTKLESSHKNKFLYMIENGFQKDAFIIQNITEDKFKIRTVTNDAKIMVLGVPTVVNPIWYTLAKK